ncbi:MAG: 4-alpha-glucanotransferase [Bacilli bacterium]|nr:4-alpha-glucanotransferase [Bacilli bacterium]
MKNNKYGVLLAISSLPSDYGIGDFGVNAYKFADFLAKRGYKYWQILPLNPIGPGNSPYMSTCSEAIEPRYIDLNELVELGYLNKLSKNDPNSKSVDYQQVGIFKEKYLYKAFLNFLKNPLKGYDSFKKNNKWVYPFAVYTVVRKHRNNQTWIDWPYEWKFYYINNKIEDIPEVIKTECEFQMFMQFIAYRQWNNLKKYINKKGIKVIADCPFYVGIDSVDCWLNKDQFVMNERYQPTLVSGCPPDAFSDDGQLWGTPIYDFNKMKENKYSFLINRIGYLASTCDYLRIDHFRAFDTYCVIPASDDNARRGEWIEGPRTDFFDTLFAQYPNINIIAEDLGELFPSVHELRDHYNLPGMFVTQFMIMDENNISNDNQIVYPGTHDNQTLYGWIKSLSNEDKIKLKKRFKNANIFESVAQFTWEIPSKMTIFPLQDILKLDDSSRMNLPGTTGSPNWEWKLKDNSYVDKIKFGL